MQIDIPLKEHDIQLFAIAEGKEDQILDNTLYADGVWYPNSEPSQCPTRYGLVTNEQDL